MGMRQLDPSIGGVLKNLGYATGQFGKNHLGDRNESLPTVQRLRRILRQSLSPQCRGRAGIPGLPKRPRLSAPNSVRAAYCAARRRIVDDPTVDPRFGKIGKQTIEDTGALTKKRMETIDDETSAAAIDYISASTMPASLFRLDQYDAHAFAHACASIDRGRYRHGGSEYVDGMIEHDGTIGRLLKALDDIGIANNTIVVYTSDNGPHMNTWPDGAMTGSASEKNTNWEGASACHAWSAGRAYRAGTVTNELMSTTTGFPTLSPSPASRTSSTSLKGRLRRRTATTIGSISTATTSRSCCAASSLGGNNNNVKTSATSFSIQTMTACWSASARATGR